MGFVIKQGRVRPQIRLGYADALEVFSTIKAENFRLALFAVEALFDEGFARAVDV